MQAAFDGSHPRWGDRVNSAVAAAILLSAVLVSLETLPDLGRRASLALKAGEIFCLTLFLAEYLLRLWTAPRPMRYAFSFWGIVDFLACVPGLVFLFPDAQVVRVLRLVRLLKLLRLTRALDRLEAAFRQVRSELLVFLVLSLVVLYLAAVGIYHFEHETQPEAFTSIPESLWWAMATLTTVGYGDIYPVTAAGRMFTALILFVGLGIVAIPAAMITAALMGARNPEEPNSGNHDKGET